MKKYLIGVLILCVQLQGCQDVHDKAQDFVEEYNTAAASISTTSLQSTMAVLKPDNTIYIVMVSSIGMEDANTEMFDKVLPKVMTEMLRRMPSFQELVDEGVKFKVEYRASDNTALASTIIDQASLKRQMKVSAEREKLTYGTSNPRAEELLRLINSTLPIVDKKSGTRITTINMKGRDFIFTIEAGNKFRELFHEEEVVNDLKKSLSGNVRIQKILKEYGDLEADRVICRYMTSQNEIIGEIVIERKDFESAN